jgi:fused signal recognition particle receptor
MQTLFGSTEERGWLDKLRQAVRSTKQQLSAQVEEIFEGGKQIDAALLEVLEAALISADLGVKTTGEVLEKIRLQVDRQTLKDAEGLKSALKQELLGVLESVAAKAGMTQAMPEGTPRVIFVVGVNGTGKTTSIGKLAYRLRQSGKQVLICAADTFRAAAIEQLEIWAQRIGSEMIRQKPGADPAAVVFDSLSAAVARKTDCVIVDTAGRVHTKSNLMAELEKMKRTAAKIVPGAPHEVLLVIDATTGQNGLAQARVFMEKVGVTGIILTKLDGTAKGGIVLAIARELAVPIQYVGTGETLDDLLPFHPKDFVESLFA